MKKPRFRSFEEARSYVRSLKFKVREDYYLWAKTSKRPKDIPVAPHEVYREKWKSAGDWLRGKPKFRSFDEARKYVQLLNLKNQQAYYAWSKTAMRPDDIPSTPHVVYKDHGWLGYGDWLGTGTSSPRYIQFYPYRKAKAYIQRLKFKTASEYWNWAKTPRRPKEIPRTPNNVYAEWVGWGDWLGSGTIASKNKKFRSFLDARKYARSLQLSTRKAYEGWSKTRKRPDDIPACPHQAYRDQGWMGYEDWLKPPD